MTANLLALLWTCLTLLLTACAVAGSYYVSPTGKDTNPGSEARPFASLKCAEAAVRPGDTVIIEDGTHYLGRDGLTIEKSGTPQSPITYRARNAGKAKLISSERLTGFEHYRGRLYRARLDRCPSRAYEDHDALHRRWEDKFTGPDDPRIQRGYSAWFDGYLYVWPWEDDDPSEHRIDVAFNSTVTLAGSASHRVWEGLVFERCYFGIKWATRECRDHVVRNCLFMNGAGGIGGGGHSIIEHCTFYNLGPSAFEHGIYNGQEHTLIRYNHFERVSGGALHLYKNPRAMTVHCNTIGPPKTRRVTDPSFKGMHVGIYAWGQGEHRIYRNVIYGGHRVGISLYAPNSLVTNNTIVDTRVWGLLLLKGQVGNTVVNNILAGEGLHTSLASPKTRLDFNLYAGPGRWSYGGLGHRGGQEAASLEAFRRLSGEDAHSRCCSDPQFADPARGDYRVSVTSPAIDAGTPIAGVTGGCMGSAPDIGAFEADRAWPERPGVRFAWRPAK